MLDATGAEFMIHAVNTNMIDYSKYILRLSKGVLNRTVTLYTHGA